MRILVVVPVLAGLCAAGAEEATPRRSIPPAVERVLACGTLGNRYVPCFRINPFYLRGDWDGDGVPDYAVLVKERRTQKVGIVLGRPDAGRVSVVGAGQPLGNGGDDFEWMDHWYVCPRKPVSRGVEEGKPPALKGEALWVEKREAASARIHWTGKKYAWYHQGD